MGELFPIVIALIAVLAIVAVLAYKSNMLKPSDEQDVVTRYKVGFSGKKAKEIADAMLAAVESKEPDQVVEFYEEGTGRLIRFEID